MWIFTVIGFFSVVEDRNDKKKLCVRARAKGDLDNMRKQYCPSLGPTILPSGKFGADYAARAFVSKKAFGNAMFKMMKDITYTNFKSHVMKTQGWDRESIYMGVWSKLKDAQSSGKFDRIGTPAPIYFDSDFDFTGDVRVQGRRRRGHGLFQRSTPSWDGPQLRLYQRETPERSGSEDEIDPDLISSPDLSPHGFPEGTHRQFTEEEATDPFFWADGDSYVGEAPEFEGYVGIGPSDADDEGEIGAMTPEEEELTRAALEEMEAQADVEAEEAAEAVALFSRRRFS